MGLRQLHAMIEQVVDPGFGERIWKYYRCRCGYRYVSPTNEGYATRAEARKLHKAHVELMLKTLGTEED